jgi:light-regulated signal transduction histidine kinase (bacteriophytochrome)
VASHELKEPLRTVSNFTQRLARSVQEKLDATGADAVERIVNGARFMQRLVEELYYYAKVGREGKVVATDCNQVFAAVCGNLRAAFEECGAVVTADPLPTLPGVETELMRLFQNLIGNAIKFRGTAPPRVHVTAVRQGDAWQFSVRDNGIGIEPQCWEKIFGIGQKSRLHPRSRYPGTDFGLAFCKKIVEHHGGRIRVDSQPGQGSTFSFTLSVNGPAPTTT